MADARGESRKRPSQLVPPQLSAKFELFEYSVHSCPGSLRRDLAHVFPGVDLTSVLLLPTLQKARVPLDCYGDQQATEKDRLQSAFFEWVKVLRGCLQDHWIDATDPASGAAVYGSGAGLYSDVPPIARLLRYPTTDAGGCTILLHPDWGSSVYPATVFTTAPLPVLVNALSQVNDRELHRDC